MPTSVIVYSVGEITRPGRRYDYAKLHQTLVGKEHLVWSMTWESSVHAGGADKNRIEVAVLTLDPGVYTLQYVTDGSHSVDAWNAPRPDFPTRWGVSLFRLRKGQIGQSISVVPAFPHDGGSALINWTRLGGSVREHHAFKLTERHRFYIVATGEITVNKQYDYGWIIDLDRGNTVWEMTWHNTSHAGGSRNNRRFDGIVELDAGDYIAYFETDGSHHHGSFDGAPDDPDSWGLTMRKINGQLSSQMRR